MSTKAMALPSISLASIVIGFISFSFTLAIVSPTQITFFRYPGSAERNSVQALGWKSQEEILASQSVSGGDFTGNS
jgi:hypothetical protein